MKAASNKKTIPRIPLLSLQASPKTSLIFSNPATQPPSPEIPQLNIQTPNCDAPTLPSPNTYRTKTASVGLKRPGISRSREKKIDDNFFSLLEGMRGVREKSEKKLQETVEEFNRLKKQPMEKLKWDEMLETGQYIGTRKVEKKKDGTISARVLSKEKVLQDVRHQIIGLKYEQKNRKNVVKHLTTKEPPDLAKMAQPQVTHTDLKLVTARQEAFRVINSARQPATYCDVKNDIAKLNFDVVDSPGSRSVRENMMTFNKGQLQKLKQGLTYMNKWMQKYGPVMRSGSYRSEDASREYEEVLKTKEDITEGNHTEENHLEPKTIRRAASTKVPDGELTKKTVTKKQMIEERIINLNPQNEFLRRLGLSGDEKQKGSKSSFFLTGEETTIKETVVTSPGLKEKKIIEEYSPKVFFPTPKFRNASGGGVASNDPSYIELTKTPRESTGKYIKEIEDYCSWSNNGSPRTTARTGSEGRTWRTMKKSLMSRESVPRSPNAVKGEEMKEREELITRYKRISMECEHNEKFSKNFKSNLDKNFDVLEQRLAKIQITARDREIDERLEREIKDEIRDSYVINPHFGRMLLRRFSVNQIMK